MPVSAITKTQGQFATIVTGQITQRNVLKRKTMRKGEEAT